LPPVRKLDLERVRAIYAPLNELGELDAELFDPAVEWHNAPEVPDATVHHGLDALMADFRQQAEAWEDRHFEPVELIDGGEHVVVFVRIEATGKSSGAAVQLDVFHVFTIRDEKIVRVQAFIDREQALAAAGIKSG
jgi:uncharacterized protein